MRILYLEDDFSNLALLQRVAQMHQDELTSVQHPDDAIAALTNNDFDVVIADIDLGVGVMDGLEFAAYLRENGYDRPIVMITAYDFEEYYRRSIEVGSDYHFLKPVSVNELVTLLDELRR